MVCSCANIIPPGGGEVDLLPPRFIHSVPPNGSVLFNESEITILFDEYIQLQNVGMIKMSPDCGKSLQVTQRGKQIKIRPQCNLEENTTYTINFGKSIIDLNEGNVLKNFKYTFSTGPHLDSLSVRGKINHLYEGVRGAGMLVGLYLDADSISPYYYTFSDSSGYFLIDNIKAGNYVLSAIDDNNGNFSHDVGELTSFPEPVSTFDTIIDLGLFYDVPVWPIISAENNSKNSIEFKHNVINDSIFILNSSGIWDISKKSSVFWLDESPPFIIYEYNDVIDSIGKTSVDSIKIFLDVLGNVEEVKKEKMITVKSNKPIKRVFPDLFTWLDRSTPIKPVVKNLFTIIIPIDFNIENSEETLIINSGALVDRFDSKSDSVSFSFDFNPDHYGALKLKSPFFRESGNAVVELFQKNVVIRKKNIADSVSMSFIPPGKYGIRIFEDINNDFLWTPGSIIKKTRPESVHIYSESIDIKSNWEIEVEIKPEKTK